ncbi:Scr1 family TA system antitoxin-like transcriptional regulator [Nonomuraea sp. NPDC050663]|uniref:Scr1 family TA system antitoxin-like transcriptional regulator n=1 Tax=Nonomuraea sp. NPDC050663 TaxID=3364370 RepID=UPI00378E41A3
MRVLPLDGRHPINTGVFVHVKFQDLDDAVYLESLYGARIVEDLELVADYEFAFEHLRATALSEDDSRKLIQQKIASGAHSAWPSLDRKRAWWSIGGTPSP